MEPFVLLVDALVGRSRRLTGLVRVDPVDLGGIDAALGAGWAEGLHCFAWLPYTLGEAHLGLLPAADGALYWFAESADEAPAPPAVSPGWLTPAVPDVDQEHYADTVARLQEAIAAGTSYQVNYTHPRTARLHGDPIGLWHRLRARQPVAYGVLAHLPGPAAPWTLSLSPELFLEVADGRVLAKPMKGTAPATEDPGWLRDDPKNRAENLMIVDLLRNDLSRVAVPGSVAVERLYETERVGGLWQLTSSITCDPAPGCTPGTLLAATFPCGSITGAPKLAAMRLIRAAEGAPRGLYTGSLGTIDPDPGALGWRLRLSVAIRTVEIAADGAAILGIGSGIVADSDPAAEWLECEAKAAFVAEPAPPVALFETIRVVDGVAPLAAGHAARLAASAAALGFPPPGDAVAAAVAGTASSGAWAVRVGFAGDGATSVTRRPLEPTAVPVRVLLAPEPWPAHPLAGHKTDARAHLDAATAWATSHGAFDAIGHDASGRVLEGGRCSVFALVDGRWLTPPTSLGVLPGVQRAALLADPSPLGAGRVEEAELTVAQLRRSGRIVVTNALRGLLEARLEDE